MSKSFHARFRRPHIGSLLLLTFLLGAALAGAAEFASPRRDGYELGKQGCLPYGGAAEFASPRPNGPAARAEEDATMNGTLVYFGTYTGGKSRGIYAARLDAGEGKLSGLELAAESESPSFLALHPTQPWLFAVNEVANFRGTKAGAVSAFRREADGKLTLLNQQSSGGGGPCHLVVSPGGRHVLAANYGGGSVTVLPIGEDGRLGEATAFVQHEGHGVNPRRQERPHAHSINVDAAGRFACAADLGLDQVLVYRFDAQRGTLAPNDPPFAKVAAGAGPRHFAFHPSGRFAYLINEMNSTVTAFAYDTSTGTLAELHSITTLPTAFEGNNSTAEVQVHPSGKFLYGSNRGHDSIATFAIDGRTGRLTAIGHQPTGGKTPRNFGIDPAGRYLLAANQASDSVVVFRIDPQTGRLEATGSILEVPTPVCVKFVAK